MAVTPGAIRHGASRRGRRVSSALLAGLFLLACVTPAAAQRAVRSPDPLAWPLVTRDARPWTRWWWLGSAVDKPGLTSQLSELATAGFGGVEITVIYGARGAESAYLPYLSPRWVDMIAHTATEARRLGMAVDLPQGSGWRIGGPTVTPGEVNTSMRITVDSVADGATWNADLTGRRVVAVVAFSGAGQRIDVPISAAGGPVQWVAPAGRWLVHTLELRFSGDNVKRPSPGGEGPALDPFSAAATARYLAMFRERTAALPHGALRSYFHDSFEYTGNATPTLFAEFQRRRGYDLIGELPALAGRADADRVARVKSDYRQTMDELLRENFVDQLTRWSHGRGARMREQAHGSPGNLLDLYAASDIPETEIFGVIGGPDSDPLINKFASSAAHVAGRPLASAEAFTWLGEHFNGTLDEVKQAADKMFLAGINHLIYHGTTYSPSTAAWPGWQFYASMEFNPRNAFWRDLPAFNQYVTRVQSVLQSGAPDGDVLLYWPIADNWHDAAGMRMDFKVHDPVWFHQKEFGRLARSLHESGYGVDYVSDRQLARDVKSAGGRLSAGGARYGAVVVPRTTHMPVATLDRLVALARQGASIAFVGALPDDVPGLGRLEQRRAALRTAVQAIRLGAPDAAGVRSATVGRGRVLVGESLASLLPAAGVHRDPLAASNVQFVRRRQPDGRSYFVRSGQAVDGWVAIAGEPASVVLMDPSTGRAGIARTRRGAPGHTDVLLQLAAGETRVLRTFDRPQRAAAWPYARVDRPSVPLDGPWRVEFIDGGPTRPNPFSAALPALWTGRGDDDADRFAGTARYSITFDVPDRGRRHLLELGKVAESARVRLNGRELGVLFATPFQIETGPLRARGNVLEIDVTNVSANRVRDLDIRAVPWKIFHDINFVGIDYRPFDASRWPVRPAGLLGPVRLRTLESGTIPTN